MSVHRVASRPLESFPSRPPRRLPTGWYTGAVKRGLDMVLGGVGLLLALPVLALIALVIRCSGPGPVLLRQRRVGANGAVFRMFKFRTMIEEAEPVGVPVWAADDDARVTGVGRVLRRTHLDELPQLWHVVTGTMSLVGPRPERPELDTVLEARIPSWSDRYSIRPGLTGWAQISHGYAATVEMSAQKLAFDLDYLQRCSLSFDLNIMARTLLGVVRTALTR